MGFVLLWVSTDGSGLVKSNNATGQASLRTVPGYPSQLSVSNVSVSGLLASTLPNIVMGLRDDTVLVPEDDTPYLIAVCLGMLRRHRVEPLVRQRAAIFWQRLEVDLKFVDNEQKGAQN